MNNGNVFEHRVERALDRALRSGGVDGDHHKAWVIDQMVRELTGCPEVEREATDARGQRYTYMALGESEEYLRWVANRKAGEDGPETYGWDPGVPP